MQRFPREKLENDGIEMLNDADLVKLLLGICKETDKNNKLILNVLKVIKSYNEINELYKKLKTIKGVGKAKAGIICAGLELYRRKMKKGGKISSPIDCYKLLSDYKGERQECFLVLPLNAANEIIDVCVISIGLANQTLVHSREVFVKAIEKRAINIIIAHNHPSGSVEPSENDIKMTESLVNSGKIIGIKIIDHLIISENGFYSFAEHELI